MTTRLLVALACACMVLTSCGDKNRSSEVKMEAGTMESFIKKLDLEVEGKYKEILVERKHRTDRAAPAAVRAFVEDIEPTRFSLKQGVKFEDENATFWWFISDFGAKGKPEEVMEHIHNLFADHGFNALEPQEDADGWKEYTFAQEKDGMRFLIKIKELDRFVGSKEPMCGGDIIFNITFLHASLQPTISEVTEDYPEVACPALPKEVFDHLKDKKVKHMSYGGTWEWYYTWNAGISAEDEKAAEKLLADVTGIIGELGFDLWDEEDGKKTYQRKALPGETASFMTLEIDGSLFELRFQPKS